MATGVKTANDALTVVASELARGLLPARPFLLIGQQSMTDPTRQPPGHETAWAYTHVPRRVRGDAAGTLGTAWSDDDIDGFVSELLYKTAFEKANPGIKVEVLNKNTVQGIAYVRELPVGQRPEVFWASAPDAFEVLSGMKLLDNIGDLANKAAPAKVGAYPINAPDNTYLGQALAGLAQRGFLVIGSGNLTHNLRDFQRARRRAHP